MSEDRRYKVEVLQRYAYEIWAPDEETARRAAISRWMSGIQGQKVATWPSDYEVTELKANTPNGGVKQ